MYEPIQNVFLQCLMVIGDFLTLPNFEGVVAVGEHDGEKLVFIVKEVTSMDVYDRYFVLMPEMWTFSKRKTNQSLILTSDFVVWVNLQKSMT